VPLFANLSGRDLRALADAGDEISYPSMSELASLSDVPAVFFVVAEGRATVAAEGGARSSKGPREWFGELAPLGDGPRTAVVTAETEICCLGLARWEVRALRISAGWTTCVNSQAYVNEPPARTVANHVLGSSPLM
jgi:CPA1 family monovalent cation:H+ antiporter